VESLLREAEVSSPPTRVPVGQEFPDAVFQGFDVESLLGDAEVSSPTTRVPVRKGHNF
jgi:hypothetical protein